MLRSFCLLRVTKSVTARVYKGTIRGLGVTIRLTIRVMITVDGFTFSFATDTFERQISISLPGSCLITL